MRARLARSLSVKLLAGHLVVVVAGAGTLLVVTLLLGPRMFRHHVRAALGYVPPDVGHHLDMAFHTATLVSLAIAMGVAVVAAVGISAIVSARVVRPVRALAGAAQDIAGGHTGGRVPVRGDDEIAQLASAFNAMAASLQQSEDMRRQLRADVAHELRTPLATVESYLEALADGVLPADADNWQAIRTETARLKRLVDDLQRVSSAQAHELDLYPEPVPCAELVTDAITAAGPAYKARGVHLDARVEPSLPEVTVDRERMAEVLANLLSNALRHTPESGTVAVTASHRPGWVEIVIDDTGDGLAPEHLERIFERFYRVDPARSRASGGTGIGLAITRALVEAHGGTIRASSAGPGHGATLTIRLPA